jgi:hypothetical protein
MKKKKLLNTSEYKTISELQESLEGTGYFVVPQIQFKEVLVADVHDSLSKKEKQTFNTASFDFVVYNSEFLPEFAVEFDGPCHAKQKKKESDSRKNKLCCLSKLPLLRIDDSFLTKYEGISFLKYVVDRFLAWQTDIAAISKQIEERLADFDEVDYDDPFNDPTIIFDLKYPFPALFDLATRLYDDKNIVTSYLSDDSYFDATSKYPYIEFQRNRFGEWAAGSKKRMMERSYQIEKHFINSLNKYDTEIIHELTVYVNYNWGLPTSNGSVVSTSFFQGIPGTSMNQVADNLCDYLALKKIEHWVQINLLHE